MSALCSANDKKTGDNKTIIKAIRKVRIDLNKGKILSFLWEFSKKWFSSRVNVIKLITMVIYCCSMVIPGNPY
jgi:hypothetical protein